MTSSTVLPPATANTPSTGDAVAFTPAEAPAPMQGKFDGLLWTHQRGGAALLAALPADAWSHPDRQGWRRVKENARREVWRAEVQGTPYYFKYYFNKPWRTALQRFVRMPACLAEWHSGLFAARAGIPAVRPVAFTLDVRRGRRRCAVLASEAIEPSLPLDEFWQKLQADEDPVRRRQDTAALTDALAHMIARAHQCGFEHLDMHAANILVQTLAPRHYRPLLVDLQSARQNVPIHDAAVVRNLAQLNQWFRKHSRLTDRLRFLRAYLRWRGEYEDTCVHSRRLTLRFEQLVTALTKAARRHARRLGRQRDHRVFRNGRYFARLRLPGGWRGMVVIRCKHPTDTSRASRMTLEAPWWRGQLTRLLRRFDEPAAPADECKDSHSATVRRAVLTMGTTTIPAILKRPRARNARRAIAQAWPPSRSRRAWQRGHALLHRDVPTARPLALLERRLGPFVLDSLLVTEAIPGAVDLETFLRREHASRSPSGWVHLKRALLPRLVRLMRRLQQRGFDHRDCKASNILVVEHPELRLLWIDLDGLRCRRRISAARRLRPLVRLHVSLQAVPGLTRTDRVRFLKTFLTRFGTASNAWRDAWPALDTATQRKARQLETRRAWKRKHYGRE